MYQNNMAIADNNRVFTKAIAILFLAMSLFLGACSTTSEHGPIMVGDIEVNDQFEGVNRAVFAFNDVVSDVVIHPIVEGYRFIMPKPARTGVQNFLRNLKSPITFANQLLQGDVGGAADVLTRTVVNTVVGVGGLVDVADHMGIEYENEDFGQTLAVWGVGHGPYMVAPLLGPASTRDAIGFAVDGYADPLRWWLHNIDEEGWYYAKVGADYLVLRDSFMDVLEDLESSSIDYYASVRSTYYQSREAMINDQEAGSQSAGDNAYPDFDDY